MSARYLVGDGGCWIWQGYTMPLGYGQTHKGLAHRIMYEEHRGPIPEGLELDHLCRNPSCVNPDHLEPVTHAENVHRGEVGRVNRERMLARTHCKRGHEFTPEGTSIIAGYRRCLVCAAATQRARYARARIVCRECGREQPPAAHGLCGACYQRARKARA